MKTCEVCGCQSKDDALNCPACGEASWKREPAPKKAEPKGEGKK